MAKSEGSEVHHIESALINLGVANGLVARGTGVLLGIGRVDSVYPRSLENNLGLNFNGAEGGTSVGSKVGVARSRRKNNHSALFQVADCASAYEGFANLVHLYG